MYNLPHFTETNADIVFDFMQKNSFVNIVGFDGTFPVATHVPVDVKKADDIITLTGHIMKNTTHHKAFLRNKNVMAIFRGPHCYVSASWYEKKNVASTWNYMDVQAKGTIEFYDEEETIAIIHDLTNKYEHYKSEAAFDKLSDDYISKLVKAITGFTITVSSVENVFKLSQNHGTVNRKRIIEHLASRTDADSHAIAAEMRNRLSEQI